MAIRFDGKKNEQIITCTSICMLSCILEFEQDDSVRSYFATEMEMVALHEGIEYLIPIHIWVHHFDAKPSLIGFIDPETDRIFRDHPEVLANVVEHARSINTKYVQIRRSSEQLSTVRAYFRELREKRLLALQP